MEARRRRPTLRMQNQRRIQLNHNAANPSSFQVAGPRPKTQSLRLHESQATRNLVEPLSLRLWALRCHDLSDSENDSKNPLSVAMLITTQVKAMSFTILAFTAHLVLTFERPTRAPKDPCLRGLQRLRGEALDASLLSVAGLRAFNLVATQPDTKQAPCPCNDNLQKPPSNANARGSLQGPRCRQIAWHRPSMQICSSLSILLRAYRKW